MSYLDGLPLGEVVAYSTDYSADILCPILRLDARQSLGIDNDVLPFYGSDIWNAYEVSWLNRKGLPQVASAVFSFPCNSLSIIESKSLKLYLNSFNQSRFDNLEQVSRLMASDLSLAVNARVSAVLTRPEDWSFDSELPEDWSDAVCIDRQDIEIKHYHTDPRLLINDSAEIVEERLKSHLLRSLCPVTGQPDWGCVSIAYTGQKINKESLLRYLVSYREHQEFHEQCVERIYTDLMACYQLDSLAVYARYVRRGGLDINPYRSSADTPCVNSRLFRQ